jgi:predicted RNase H-like HicB family nuclease
MGDLNEIEFVFELQKDGGYHVYAPGLPGMHTQGDDIDDAIANANEATALYIEELREDGITRSADG